MKKVTQFLQIRGVMRFLYYFVQPLALPKDKKKFLSIGNVGAWFYVNTPLDLNMAETPLLDEVAGGEKQILQILLAFLKSGDVVFDVGANIGVHTVFMAKKVGENGRIVAFEPEIHNFEALKDNINLNSIKNVVIMQIALGDSFRKGILYGISVWATLTESPKDSIGQEVKILPGDAQVRDKNLPMPKVVKIDVEGYEYYVIQGLQNTLSSKDCQMVCCEIHPTLLPSNIKPNMVINLLKSYGFNRIETHPRGETFHVFCYKG